MFRDLEKAQTVFTGIAAHVGFGANLAYRGQTIAGDGMQVSGSYFPILGIRPEIGRLLDDNDDRTPGSHFVTVLSHAFWISKLGANPSVLNDTIIVNGQSLTIVGVAARGFNSTTLGIEPEVFVPISMREQLSPGWKGLDDRRSYWAYLFARLKPGVSIDQARTAMNGAYRPIITDVEAPLQKGLSDQTMGRFRTKPLVIEPGYRGQSTVHGQARTPMILLLSVTGVVLLIACANIANLLLARAAGRSTEMAIRLSIGASRRQLLTQLLTESCVLAVLGGIAGIVVARWTLASIAALLPPTMNQTLSFELRGTVILFAAALSIATGLFFGLFPALHSTRPDLVSTLKAQAGQPSGARAASRFRTTLVTIQIALSMALLIAAGLFIKSLTNVTRVDLGLRTDNVVTFRTSPVLSGYDQPRVRVFFDRAEQELTAIPGVTGVALSRVPLLAGSNSGNDVSVEGFASGPDIDANSRMNEINAGYFRTLGIPLVAGREFTFADTTGAPKVAIVNEAFAQKFNLGREAVGKRMAVGGGAGADLDIEIVGLVQNAKYSQVKQQVPPIYFLPYRQGARVGSLYFYVRTSVTPESLLRDAPAAIARLDPNLPIENLRTLPQQVRQNIFLDRFVGTLSASFAVLATILAAVGLYGVLAYTVSQRTREIGLRMALGADGSRVRSMVLRQVAIMTLVGGVIGVAAAIAIGMSAQSLLFEMKAYDPAVIAVATVALCAVALAAGYIPAHRASRVDPMLALRYE
jgi:predicted permease